MQMLGTNTCRHAQRLATTGIFLALLAGCAVNPIPVDKTTREKLADESRERLFANQEPVNEPLDLYQATARAIKYQAEYRSKLFEEAVALGQLDVAQFDMLPRLTLNAGYSARSNDSYGLGFSNGAIAANPSTSTERTLYNGNISFSWSVLDFGMSYYRAKQLADQSLIMEERRRKAMQNLVQDVRLAWWRALAAQKLLPQIEGLIEEVEQAVERTKIIENRKLLPPLQTASIRRALMDLEQQISLRRQELAQARVELAALIGLPPGTDVQVVVPPGEGAAVLELSSSMDLLESIALRNRPEISEEIYKARVNESEIKKSLLGLIPTLNFNLNPYNYDSNRFLINRTWASAGLGVAFNLIKAFSLPAINRSAEVQRQLDQARRLAMAMAVMTQTRVATVRYGLLAHEYGVWDEATRDDEKIVGYLSSGTEVGTETEFELIRAKARHMVSRINREIVGANLEAALGRIYNSIGMDALPQEVESHDVAGLAKQLQASIESWRDANFAQRPQGPNMPVFIGDVEGIPGDVTGEFRKSMEQIFELSKVKVSGADGDRRLRVNAAVELDPPRNGGRQARLSVTLVDAKTESTQYKAEYKTTLSEPIDLEQWRTLGEGAAYRVVGPVGRLQSGRTQLQQGKPVAALGELKLSQSMGMREPAVIPMNTPASDPLQLRVAQELFLPAVQHVSHVIGEFSSAN
jgi:outer membrane protein TolC